MHDCKEDDQLAENALHVALGLFRDVALSHYGIDGLVQNTHGTIEVIRAQKLQIVHPAVLVVEEQRQGRKQVENEGRLNVVLGDFREFVD